MIVARTSSGIFILGIDAENVRRLKAGQPILKSLAQFGGKDDIAIVYGDTFEDIQKELEKHYGAMPVPSKPRVDG